MSAYRSGPGFNIIRLHMCASIGKTRTDRHRVFGKYGRAQKVARSIQKIAYGGTDRKFGTWPSSRARSTYYYYTTTGRTCQVFFEIKIKKITRAFLPGPQGQGGYTPSPCAIMPRNSAKASMQASPHSISTFSP